MNNYSIPAWPKKLEVSKNRLLPPLEQHSSRHERITRQYRKLSTHLSLVGYVLAKQHDKSIYEEVLGT